MIDLSLYGVISSNNNFNSDYTLNNINISVYPDKYEYDYPELIFNQSHGKMCVPCSLSLIRYIQYYKSTGIYNIIPDPISIYANRTIPKDNIEQEGMNVEDALNILKNKDILIMNNIIKILFDTQYNLYTYKDSLLYLNNNKSRLSNIFKIKSFYSLHSINEIKWSIMNFYAVTATIPMYMCYKYPDKRKSINGYDYYADFDSDYARMEAGYLHQITIIGWIRGYWKVVNSWGIGFANKGILYMPFDYPIKEAWVCIDKLNDNIFGII